MLHYARRTVCMNAPSVGHVICFVLKSFINNTFKEAFIHRIMQLAYNRQVVIVVFDFYEEQLKHDH